MAKEADLQRGILEWLRLHHIPCWKVSSVGIFKKKTGSYIPSSNKGMSDIHAIVNGLAVWIEVKNPNKKGKITPHQQRFIDEVNAHGGMAFVADNLDTVIQKIKPPLEVATE